jgi:HEAT repeat protein
VRHALARRVDAPSIMVRSAAIRALATLGDPAGRSALATRLEREPFGNVRRVLREALEQLGKAAAVLTATAELAKRVDDLEKAKKAAELRLEALEKRLDAPKP